MFLYGLSYLADIFGHINQRWIRGHKARGQGHKKLRAKAEDRLSEDRPSRGQGQEFSRPRTMDTTGKCSPKKGLCAKIAYFLRHFRRFSKKKKKIFAQKIANFLWNFRRRKKGHDLDPFLTNQKIVLSSAEDRTFSRTWRLRGQVVLRVHGLQNVSSRTSSVTPPLVKALLSKLKQRISSYDSKFKLLKLLDEFVCLWFA